MLKVCLEFLSMYCLISHFNLILAEIIRKNTGSVTLLQTEIDQLFESYDVEGIGYVSVEAIRDRIKSFQLAENVQLMVMGWFGDINDDEMLNLLEFSRFMNPIISKHDSNR